MDLQTYSKNALQTNQIQLRAITKEDLPILSKWWNDPSIKLGNRSQIIDIPEYLLLDQFENWSKNNQQSGFALAIIDQQQQLVGHVSVWGISIPTLCATIGIIVGPEYQNLGYGTMAMRLVMDLLFMEYHVHKIQLNVYEYNERAKHVYEKLGFQQEGRIRHTSYHQGRYYDYFVMGILEEEYLKQKAISK